MDILLSSNLSQTIVANLATITFGLVLIIVIISTAVLYYHWANYSRSKTIIVPASIYTVGTALLLILGVTQLIQIV